MLRINRPIISGVGIFLILAARHTGAAVKVGQPAPHFAVESLDGGSTIRLKDFRGRRVLVFTWASW
jgi:hypothetical protein